MLGFNPLASATLADDGEISVVNISLTTSDIATGSASVDNGVITQAHDISANNVQSGTPIVDQVHQTQVHVLSGDTISSGSPSIESSEVTESQAFSVSDFATGPPSIESVAVTQSHDWSVNDVTSGVFDLSTANMAEYETFTTSNVYTGGASVPTSALTQEHDLSADAVTSGAAYVSSVAAIITSVISASDVLSDIPSIDTSEINQDHDLSGNSVTSGSPVVDAFSASVGQNFSASNVTAQAPYIANTPLEILSSAPLINDGFNDEDYVKFWEYSSSTSPYVIQTRIHHEATTGSNSDLTGVVYVDTPTPVSDYAWDQNVYVESLVDYGDGSTAYFYGHRKYRLYNSSYSASTPLAAFGSYVSLFSYDLPSGLTQLSTVQSSKASFGNRWIEVVNDTDGTGYDIKVYDNTTLESTKQYWQASTYTSSDQYVFPLFNGRVSLTLISEVNDNDAYDADKQISILDLWNRGYVDEPSTSTGFTSSPLAGNPVVDNVLLISPHGLSANDVNFGAPIVPILDAEILSDIDLYAYNITTGNPVVDNVISNIDYVLSTTDVTTGSVNLDTVNMAEDETFTTSNVVSGAPSVPSPEYSEETHLAASDVTSGTPAIDQPQYTEYVDLFANSIYVYPFVDDVEMSEAEIFGANGVTSGLSNVASTTASEYWSIAPQMNGGYDHDEYLRYYDSNYDPLENIVIYDLDWSGVRVKEARVSGITEHYNRWSQEILFSVETNSSSPNTGYYSATISLYKGGSVLNGNFIGFSAPNLETEDTYPTNWTTYTPMSSSVQPYALRNDGSRDGRYVTLANKSGSTSEIEWTYADGTKKHAFLSVVDYIDNINYIEMFDGRAVLYVVQENDTTSSNSSYTESELVLTAFNVGWVDELDAVSSIVSAPLAGTPIIDSASFLTEYEISADDVTSGTPEFSNVTCEIISPAPSLNYDKSGRDLLKYYELQTDNQSIDSELLKTYDSTYYREEWIVPYAKTVVEYSDRWEQQIMLRSEHYSTSAIRRTLHTIIVYKNIAGYSDANSLTFTNDGSATSDNGYSQLFRTNTNKANTNNRYLTFGQQSDGVGMTITIYDSNDSSSNTVDYWNANYGGSARGILDYSAMDGRISISLFARAQGGNTNNDFQAAYVDLWSTGEYDPPSTITQIVGSPLTGNPVVDDLNMITHQEFDGDGITSGVPEIATPLINQNQAIEPLDAYSGIPFLDQAGLTENHFIVANDVNSGNFAINETTIEQDHEVVINNFYGSSHIVGNATISQNHVVLANDCVSNLPSIDTCNMSEAETFNTSTLYSNAPSVADVYPLINYNFEGVNVTSGDSFVGGINVTQEHDFVTEQITTGAPNLAQTVINQVEALYAYGITLTNYDLPTANMVEDETFNTSNIYTYSATVETAYIEQDEKMDALPAVSGNPSIPSIDPNILYGFNPTGVTSSASFVQATDLDENAGLTTGNIDFGIPFVSTANMAEAETFSTPDVLSGAIAIDAIYVNQYHYLNARDCTSQQPLCGLPEIDQDHRLILDNVSSGTPLVQTSTITQNEDMDAIGFSTGTPTVPTPIIAQIERLESEPIASGIPQVEQTSIGQDEFFEVIDTYSGTPIVFDAQVVAFYDQTPITFTSGAPIVDDVSMSEDERFFTDSINLGIPYVGNTEFLYSRKAGMTDSRNSVILFESKNIVQLEYSGINILTLETDGKNSVE